MSNCPILFTIRMNKYFKNKNALYVQYTLLYILYMRTRFIIGHWTFISQTPFKSTMRFHGEIE